jgi:hypothetical protein
MNNSDLMIQVGDVIDVEFDDDELLNNCEVVHVPAGPGDFYQILFKTLEADTIYVLGKFKLLTKNIPKPLEVVKNETIPIQNKQTICPACWQTPCTC